MNKHTKKNGFTITELVIVIVVIAILAAVLIPTFASLIKKANVSADTQVAKNLNTALSMTEAEGKKDMTFSDVQAAVREAGYILSNLNPTASENYYVWESDSNQILLVDKDMKIIYKAKDIKDAYASVDGGTWNIALSNTDLLDGFAGIQVIPALNASTVAGNGNKVTELLNAGGTVTLSEPISVTTAPTHSDGVSKDGIRVQSDAATTLDLNGQTLNAEFTTKDFRVFQVGSDFTLANGTIVSSGEAKSGGLWGVVRTFGNAEVNISNMQVSHTNTKALASGEKGAAIFSLTESTVVMEDTNILAGNAIGVEVSTNTTATLKNVTLKGIGDNGWVTSALTVCYGGTLNIESGYYEAQGNVLHIFSSGGTINVKGGTFVGGIQVDTGDANCVADSKIVISGGTFNGKAFSELTKADWAEMVTGEDSIEIDEKTGVVTITKNMVKGS